MTKEDIIMSKIDILNQSGEKVKNISLKDNVWNIEPNDAVLHNAIILAQSNRRQSSASTKTRSEVSGGGRKPWRQKGTGNARQGSIRATQWRGGGIVFGPTPNKNYTKKMNKKERRLALKSALAYKVIDKELIVVDEIKFETNKTKEMTNLLNKLNLTNHKVLVVLDELNENVCLSSRNLANIKVVSYNEVNSFDLVSADNLLITESALNKLEEVLTNE
jgi:large subunit ribosomal protein L4